MLTVVVAVAPLHLLVVPYQDLTVLHASDVAV
jgi:hypothetical protein